MIHFGLLVFVERNTHMSGLKIHRYNEGDWCVIQLEGVVDASTFQGLEEALIQLVEAGNYHLKLDLERLVSINSTGLGLILATHRQVRRFGGRLVVDKVGDNISEIFNLLGFLSLIDAEDDKGSAGAMMRK